ncbi:MAG: hypothetical protein IJV73_08195, partial [Clostridia bacterium]|nr:hypothetical protein [Clostridia bacterium]
MKLGEWLKDIRTWRRAASIAAIMILAVGWITIDILLMPREKPPTTVEIPDFCGSSMENIQAEEWLDVDIEYRYDENT